MVLGASHRSNERMESLPKPSAKSWINPKPSGQQKATTPKIEKTMLGSRRVIFGVGALSKGHMLCATRIPTSPGQCNKRIFSTTKKAWGSTQSRHCRRQAGSAFHGSPYRSGREGNQQHLPRTAAGSDRRDLNLREGHDKGDSSPEPRRLEFWPEALA